MSQLPTKKCCRAVDGGNGNLQLRRGAEEQEPRADSPNPNDFIRSAELVLPWLASSELAYVSLTCKALHRAAKSLTLRRSLDASRGFEKFPVPFVNSVDDLPYAYFLYGPSQLLHSLDRQPWGSVSPHSAVTNSHMADAASGDVRVGCDCERCGGGGSSCPCLSLEGLDGVATECGPSCGCESECGNRITQSGVSVKLKIARVRGKGWGLFADQLIRERQFVCEYAGELLTTKEAQRRQQEYDRLSSTGHFSSALLVVREHLPSGKACLRLNIDATRVGNVARFINHSCDGGNLSTVLMRSTGALLPRLCFFASRNIARDEELSFSYGETRPRPDSESRPCFCFCGASSCSGTLPSEHT
ncbi:histone-lysine N-methyltransferase SUVR3 [Punica granatum]|uniref:Uncharacterized protein n=2 Tax=Punica granatum TaxID=22663 RepID=A0A218WKZ1_PUNGR|nr:histone-lysine N-methyltransferase SUVR3 [Punica granatum]OWM73178.1 hypothetical protein CDL15_Pgr001292 [Punica granatum]PKI69173.1 hypothetical protein CRG98_010440 [Punica granatum]